MYRSTGDGTSDATAVYGVADVLEASYKSNVKGFVDVNSSTGYPDRRYPITNSFRDMDN